MTANELEKDSYEKSKQNEAKHRVNIRMDALFPRIFFFFFILLDQYWYLYLLKLNQQYGGPCTQLSSTVFHSRKPVIPLTMQMIQVGTFPTHEIQIYTF